MFSLVSLFSLLPLTYLKCWVFLCIFMVIYNLYPKLLHVSYLILWALISYVYRSHLNDPELLLRIGLKIYDSLHYTGNLTQYFSKWNVLIAWGSWPGLRSQLWVLYVPSSLRGRVLLGWALFKLVVQFPTSLILMLPEFGKHWPAQCYLKTMLSRYTLLVCVSLHTLPALMSPFHSSGNVAGMRMALSLELAFWQLLVHLSLEEILA